MAERKKDAKKRLLLDFIEATPKQQHWRPLIVFLLGTGARIGEAVRASDVKGESLTMGSSREE